MLTSTHILFSTWTLSSQSSSVIIPFYASHQSIMSMTSDNAAKSCTLRRNYFQLSSTDLRWSFRKISTHPHLSMIHCQRKEDGDVELNFSSDIGHTSKSFVGLLLERALSVFVKSQLERCGELKISVSGKSEELLTGRVRQVQIFAKDIVFKGISLTNVCLRVPAVQLRFNNARILEQPFYVNASIVIKEDDLIFSLHNSLLQESLSSFLPQNLIRRGQSSTLSASIKDGFLLLSTWPSYNTVMALRADPMHGITGYKTDEKQLPVAVQLHVETDGESIKFICTDTKDHRMIAHRKFIVGPEAYIRKLEVCPSNILLTGDFLVQP